jgi:hypothetical protein
VNLQHFLGRPAFRRVGPPHNRSPFVGIIEETAVKPHLICAIALALAATGTAVSAQDSDSFIVQSKVPAFCANMGAAPGPLELGELSDANGYVITAFSGPTTYSVPGYYCNAPATIKMTATPLRQTQSPAPTDAGFTNRVDYTASLAWGAVNSSVNSVDDTPNEITSGGPTVGNLVVTVSGPDTDGNRRPIAGAYAGAVTLTIVAQ